MADEGPKCSGPRAEEFNGSVGLRIGSIFIIWASATVVTLFPIVTRRIPRLSVPSPVFDFAKYFGSGVIIATAFIHLLQPGVEELQSKCLSPVFYDQYPAFPFAFAMISMLLTFLVELFAFRAGSSLAKKLAYDPHVGGHHHAGEHVTQAPINEKQDLEKVSVDEMSLSAQASEILGVMILEFGVVFHSVIIGITLGTTNEFKVLVIVIIFHQMFEGLGLGSRLAFLPAQIKPWIPYVGAIVYGLVTPIGIAIGLGVRTTYNEDSATANYVTGVFDSVSAGILIYTATVELLAHEFIFNEKMRTAPLGKVLLNVGEMFLGAGLMALLGRWA